MPNDRYDFGKHYFILDKKLEDHIRAHNNPHKLTAKEIGLENIQDRPLDVALDPTSENYITNAAVTNAIIEIEQVALNKQDKIVVNLDLEEDSPQLISLKMDDVIYAVQPILDTYVTRNSPRGVENRAIYTFVTESIKDINVNTLLEKVEGYDASKTQTLKNVNGTFTWVDDE